MSWIEGVGDEVTITFAIITVLFVIVVAWLSTGIRDIPFIRVVVIQLTRRRHQQQTDQPVDPLEADLLVQQPGNVGEAELHTDSLVAPLSVADEISGHIGERTDSETNNIDETEEDGAKLNDDPDKDSSIVEDGATSTVVEHPSSTELRQRRLDFYKDTSYTSSDCINQAVDQSSKNKVTANKKFDKNVSKDEAKETGFQPVSVTDLTSDHSTVLDSTITGQTESRQAKGDVENQTRESGSQSAGNETAELAADEIRVRLKYLNDTQRLVKASPSETIGNFRRKHFPDELSESKLVRFIFNGQDLRNDNSTLQACNIIDNSVVHCLITQPREQPGHLRNHEEDGLLDIGIFMFPLFGVLLGIVWYLRFTYRQFFNVTSTLTLGGITFLYLAAFLSSLRGHRPHQHLE